LGLRFGFAVTFPNLVSSQGVGGVARNRRTVCSNFVEPVMADYTTPADEEFFGAIGRLTISWAHIEAGIDITISIARHVGGAQVQAAPPRTGLSRKITYLRKWLKIIKEPTFCAAVEKLITDIEQAAHARHDIIHGFIIQQAEGSGEADMVRILGTAADPYRKKEYKVTTVEILRAANDANKLAGRSLRLGTMLQEGIAAMLKKIEKPGGEL